MQSHAGRRMMATVPSWATLDPDAMSGANPCTLRNLAGGKWIDSAQYTDIVDPMKDGEIMVRMPDTQVNELKPFVDSLSACPKTGLHNPLKNPERYVNWGEINYKIAEELSKPEVEAFFIKTIQRVMPKSWQQAYNEVHVTRTMIKTWGGDSVRFFAQDFGVSGDHLGQASRGYRFPYGPVAIVAPFNFPFEIPILQLMGALYMGNKPVIKGSPYTSLVLEQYIRLMHHCGMPTTDVDLIHSGGPAMEALILSGPVRLTQFTGSGAIAERLAEKTRGKIKIEDAGYDWKILGPDVSHVDYVSWVSDQDAYAMSGQKCSAQSICFIHENWAKAGFTDKIKKLASRRSLADETISPVLSVSNEVMLGHINALLQIPGARLEFGGVPLTGHSIPKQYGAMPPTAVFVPLQQILKPENFDLVTTEIFGPFQILTEYAEGELDLVLEATERMSHHLTAGVVSNDPDFQLKVLGNTVNGTTYAGIKARTTGAPANHWFGPAGDPRGAGIGTPEAIRMVWSCHREIVEDRHSPPADWVLPKAT